MGPPIYLLSVLKLVIFLVPNFAFSAMTEHCLLKYTFDQFIKVIFASDYMCLGDVDVPGLLSVKLLVESQSQSKILGQLVLGFRG